MNDSHAQGVFEGEVLTRLDNLKEMGMDLKECMRVIKLDHVALTQRVSFLEHERTRLRTFAAVCSALTACVVGLLIKIVFK